MCREQRKHNATTHPGGVTFIDTSHVYTHRVATSHGRCTRAHTPCRSVTRSVYTCAHTVSQRHTVGVHVRTHRVATSHGRCTRAHRPCRNVTRSVYTRAHTVSQRHALGVHVRTHRVATSCQCVRTVVPCGRAYTS